MTQHWIPAAFVRGGTSKGLFFEARDLPPAQRDRDEFLLAALGSPDPYGVSWTAWAVGCRRRPRP